MSAAIPTLPAINSLILGTDDKGQPVSLPVEPTEKMAVIGVSGSGKTWAAGVLVEQWIKSGTPVAVLDPVGIWYGLRAGLSGKAEGGIAIPVYGGLNGDTVDLPNPETAAQQFALEGQSMVLDISELMPEEKQEWAATFARELMSAGCQPVRPCHIVIDEARMLIPQKGGTSGKSPTGRCKAAFIQLGCVGRNRGYGLTLIAQRTAQVDKDVLTQANSLLLLRLAASLDRKTITEWVASNSAEIDTKKVLAYLAEAENGEGMLWAPTWLKDRPRSERYVKIKIGLRETFHVGPGAKPTEMLPIALPGLGIASDGLDAIGKIVKFLIKATLVLGGLWLAWKILSVGLAVVGLALLLWIVFGK
jgi:hypothetical protein